MDQTAQSLDQSFSPFRELCAYEALCGEIGATTKRIAEKFSSTLTYPSDLISESIYLKLKEFLLSAVDPSRLPGFSIVFKGMPDYPIKLLDAKYPVELIYYQGYWDLAHSDCIAVIGTREPTEKGIQRTKKLVKYLVKEGYTIVSGLAKGIDTVAHQTAIESGGKTIAVIGTPLTYTYPAINAELQKIIAKEHLVVSQVPFYGYEKMSFKSRKIFFPERNVTMSALSNKGSIIVEASETSGTLIQARAAIAQKRKLLILENNFQNSTLTWPEKFIQKGAIKISDFGDIKECL